MILQSPIEITPRLLPGVRVGGAFVSIEYAPYSGSEGRTLYRYHIDLPESERGERTEVTGDDLQSGCGGGSLQSGLESLLCFLGACGDALCYAERHGIDPADIDNFDLFPPVVARWAAQYVEELAVLQCELEEAPGLIEE